MNIFCHMNSYFSPAWWLPMIVFCMYAKDTKNLVWPSQLNNALFVKTCEAQKLLFTMNHTLSLLGSSFVTVFAGCGHGYWRAASLLHGTGGTAVRSRSWWWRLWGIRGDAGAGTERTGLHLISYCTPMSEPSPSYRQQFLLIIIKSSGRWA